MPYLSIIVPAYNCAPTIVEALESAEASIAHLRAQPDLAVWAAEVVVVDDGSIDGTRALAEGFAHGRPNYTTVYRRRPSSPAAARNAGVAASRGELLFFLDGDDAFLPAHLAACVGALAADDRAQFVETGVAVSDPVHPEWLERIVGSLALNLAVRRGCHDFVGGFPDAHLARRDGDGFAPYCDLFYKFEDVFYHTLLRRLVPGLRCEAATVLYRRHPGNSFDRQYAKFRRPPGEVPDDFDPADRRRASVCEVLIEDLIEQKRGAGPARPRPGVAPPGGA